MKDENVYKNRDMLLGEIHASMKAMEKWCKDHDKQDESRFFWTCTAILVVAVFTGVLPELAAYFTDHIKF